MTHENRRLYDLAKKLDDAAMAYFHEANSRGIELPIRWIGRPGMLVVITDSEGYKPQIMRNISTVIADPIHEENQ